MSEETIVKCFKRTNISHENQQTAVTDADDPFKSLEEELSNLCKLDKCRSRHPISRIIH